uniref:Nucleoside-diphosphate sugar epimerase n=1 Tax=Anisakis simplex TaxID=6269 RepID=A0A0M3KK27_ANISI
LLHGNDQGTSIMVIRRFMTHQMPAVPNVEMPLVDVRDVARAHIRSMTEPKSDGQRILLVSQPSFSFMQIANTLRQEFGPQGI